MSEPSGHVLIIEDEPIIAIELEMLLGELGYRSFAVADTPDGALTSAREHRPDLITADYRIVAGTGLEAVRLITDALGRIPVVYVTGNPDILAGEPRPTVVDKPISPAALRRACAYATGAPSPS
ncbi:response regulator [Phenylobacterium sp.]|uniref:response regulator n=1 Tax=Phenylobacterium sp. TaxID=1871053 RepID=UPI0025FD7CCB|nr:response regulator [Phenylobacterium sp.]